MLSWQLPWGSTSHPPTHAWRCSGPDRTPPGRTPPRRTPPDRTLQAGSEAGPLQAGSLQAGPLQAGPLTDCACHACTDPCTADLELSPFHQLSHEPCQPLPELHECRGQLPVGQPGTDAGGHLPWLKVAGQPQLLIPCRQRVLVDTHTQGTAKPTSQLTGYWPCTLPNCRGHLLNRG